MQAGGGGDGFVAQEAVVGLDDEGLAGAEVGAAGGVLGELARDVGESGGADGDGGCARGGHEPVEEGRVALRGDEALAVLEEEGEWCAL